MRQVTSEFSALRLQIDQLKQALKLGFKRVVGISTLQSYSNILLSWKLQKNARNLKFYAETSSDSLVGLECGDFFIAK